MEHQVIMAGEARLHLLGLMEHHVIMAEETRFLLLQGSTPEGEFPARYGKAGGE